MIYRKDLLILLFFANILLVFSQDGIIQINPDGSGEIMLISSGKEKYYNCSISPDGNKIAALTFEKNLYIMDSDGSNVFKITDHVSGFERPPSWSPDSSMLVFTRNISNNLNEIYIYNTGGSDIRLISDSANDYRGPVWSPENDVIAFYKFIWGNPFEYEVQVINADGTDQRILTSGFFPVWSSDGSRLVYIELDGYKKNICIIDLDGSNKRVIAEGHYPSVSKDKIYFYTSNEEGIYYICSINIDGRGYEEITEGFHPTVSPDGKMIAFMKYVEIPSNNEYPVYNANLYLINTDGTGLITLAEHPSDDMFPEWRPDSNKIIFVRYTLLE